jgi:hypothetical protein
MFAAKPKPILIIAGLLVVLALLSGTSALTSRVGFTRTRQPGALTGNNTQGGNGGNFQGGNGNNGNFQGGNGNNGNFQARGGTNAFGSIFRVLGPSFIYISIGITVLGILLSLLSAWGVWKQKKWALNLAMVLALLFLVAALPGLFSLGGRNINWLRTSITVLNLIASAPILVLGILPSVRDFVS